MSRRPRAVQEQRLARALRTMAPGGRLASESPVRRPRFTGGAAAPPSAPFLVIANAYSFGPGVTYGVGEPPESPVYMIGSLGGEDFFPAQGYAAVVFIAHYDAGTVTIPSGWTVELTGSLNGLSWELAWATHLSGPLDNEVVFSDWDVDTSRAAFATFQYTMDDPLLVDPLPDWAYDFQCTTPVTASGAASHDLAQPQPLWGGATSLCAAMSEGAPTWPYLVADPDITISGARVNDNLGNQPQVGALYPATDDDYLPIVAEVNLSFNAGNGTFASMGIGWA